MKTNRFGKAVIGDVNITTANPIRIDVDKPMENADVTCQSHRPRSPKGRSAIASLT